MIDIVENITREDFYRHFVKPGKTVLLKGIGSKWPAVSKWNYDFFKQVGGNLEIPLKTGDVSQGKKVMRTIAEYTSELEQYEKDIAAGTQREKPAYLHDVPIFLLLPQLKQDVEPFPDHLFPSFYRNSWWSFVQFFMGSTNSLTPLHFDTLCTHNLFFQVCGSKRFYIVPAKDRDKCYLNSWRWAGVDLENPDFKKFPLLEQAQRDEVLVEPGDALFMPSGTLHQVRGLSYSISFNIDWHTPSSVATGLTSGFRGAPRKNVFYNGVIAAGLYLGIRSKYLFKYYKSYLNYVS